MRLSIVSQLWQFLKFMVNKPQTLLSNHPDARYSFRNIDAKDRQDDENGTYESASFGDRVKE